LAWDVVTFGEAMGMFIAEDVGELHKVSRFTMALAGAETNVAVGLSRLGYSVGWVSRVGDDAFGRYIVESLRGEGVDISRVRVDPRRPTGFQLKSKTLSGDPEVQYFRKGSAASAMQAGELEEEYFAEARHLHMTGIPPALSKESRAFAEKALTRMKSANRTVSFDPNLRPTLWDSREEMISVVNGFACQADVVLPGVGEGFVLTGYREPRDIAAFYLERGAKLVVVKLGADGAYYRTADEEAVVPGYSVANVVDTVGAGDGFAVGVISGMLDGLPLRETVRRANAIGALAVTAPGDQDGLPTRAQLESFIFEHGVN